MRIPLNTIPLDLELSAEVQDSIAELKERSRDYSVEQDVFFRGQVGKNSAKIDGVVNATGVFGTSLLVSTNLGTYNDYFSSELVKLSKALNELSVAQDENMLVRLLQTFYTREKKQEALEILEKLPARYFVENGTGPRKVTPEVVLSYLPRDVYGPEMCWHSNPFTTSRRKVIDKLKKAEVIGYFHTHLEDFPELPTKFSQEDIDFCANMKSHLGKDNFLLGVSGKDNDTYLTI
ncbi:MAG: hypothetical protein ABIG93_01020 [archaeon]|nr:hypothetical protein [Nanoarchaeota archaeon]